MVEMNADRVFSFEDFMEQADQALYAAKQSGRYLNILYRLHHEVLG